MHFIGSGREAPGMSLWNQAAGPQKGLGTTDPQLHKLCEKLLRDDDLPGGYVG